MKINHIAGIAILLLLPVFGCNTEVAENIEIAEYKVVTPPAYDGEFNPNGLEVGPDVGQLAPEIVGVDLDGVPFKLSDYRGKVVMLDFYGNW